MVQSMVVINLASHAPKRLQSGSFERNLSFKGREMNEARAAVFVRHLGMSNKVFTAVVFLLFYRTGKKLNGIRYRIR